MKRLVLGVCAPFAALVTFVVFVAAVISPSSATSVVQVGVSSGTCAVTGTAPGLTAEQQANAAAVAGVAIKLGLGQQGATIGITAALTESSLINVNFGDRSSNGQMTTSRGLFQQKLEWGPLSTRLDPAGAATLFFTGGHGGQRGLAQIPNWQTMPIPQAAQSVQGSAFSGGSNYLAQLARATTITNTIVRCTTSVSSPGGVLVMNPSQDPSTFGWVRAANQVPFTWQGHNMGMVAGGTEPMWAAMLTELVPLIPGGLQQGACFADRQNVNNPSNASFHSFGLACDLNWAQNGNGQDPASLQGGQFVLPMTTGQVVAKYGMEWGGLWRSTKDPMHIELHLTPAQVASFGKV